MQNEAFAAQQKATRIKALGAVGSGINVLNPLPQERLRDNVISRSGVCKCRTG